MTKNQSFGLLELADMVINKQIKLPTVQRGFVWKPSQIENLWDSLMRGYPIGAIVLSQQENDVWSLLDGQQRLTAICLGLGKETFREVQVKIFVDLIPPEDDDEDTRKFVFRAITRSHPWGYQRKDNTKTLDSSSIRKALELYNIEDPMEERNLSRFFPYDAKLPIPFEYFVGASMPEDVWKKVASTGTWKQIRDKWWKDSHPTAAAPSAADDKQIKEQVLAKIKKILERANAILQPENDLNQSVPALFLDQRLLNPTDDQPIAQTLLNTELDDDSPDEIENLFVRLNAGGTPLRGEELNYSIFKSHIDSETQKTIENACGQVYDPARFITIAYRLFQHQNGMEYSVSMQIKPKQFQRAMANKDNREKFIKLLNEVLDPNAVEQETLIGYAKKVLIFDKNNVPFGLPYPLVARLSDEAPEIVFLLLYRIWIMKDRFSEPNLHKKMLGVISLFTWLGKEKKKGYRQLLSNIWPAAKVSKTEQFWSAATIRRGQIDEILPPIPEIDDLKRDFTSLYELTPSKWRKKFDSLMQTPFASKIFDNRSLVLFAQRKFLDEWFNVNLFHLNDTDAPFDWDHISAHRFIDGKRNIQKHVKDCYSMIGNFRAWPYSLNRMDHDAEPAKKLNPLFQSGSKNDKHVCNEACQKWEKVFKSKTQEFKCDSLSNKLLAWSFCEKEWLDCNEIELKKAKNWMKICELIITRNLNICDDWYQAHDIKKLVPTDNIVIKSALNKKQWKGCDKEWEEDFDIEDKSYWIKPIVSSDFSGKGTYLYIGYPNVDDCNLGILKHKAIEFGIFEKDEGKFIKGLTIPEEFKSRYNVSDGRYIYGLFTLISDDIESYQNLFYELLRWLEGFPKQKIWPGFAEEFKSSLNKDYAPH